MGFIPDKEQPSTSGFTPDVIEPVATVPSQVERGGFGFNVSPTIAQRMAGQRVLERELESRGSAPGLRIGAGGEIETTAGIMSAPRSFLEGAGKGASLGLNEALAKLILNPDFTSDIQPRVQSPKSFELGQFIGTLLNPFAAAGAVGGTTLSLGQKIIQGLKAGAGIGATAGASGVVAEKGRETTLPELTKGTGIGALVGGAIGGGLPAGTRGAEKLANVPRSLLGVGSTPEKLAATAEARRLASTFNVPLTMAELSGTKPVSQIENTLRMIPWSGGQMQQAEQTQFNALKNSVDNYLSKYPKTPDPSVLGAKVQDAIAKETKLFKDEAATYYGAVRNLIPPGSDGVKMINSQKEGLDFINQLSQVDPVHRAKGLYEKINALTGLDSLKNPTLQSAYANANASQRASILAQVMPEKSWEGAQMTRAYFGDMIKKVGADTSEGRMYTVMKGAIDKDMKAYADQHPGQIKDAYDLANAYYSSGKEIFNDPKIIGLIKARPENVHELLVGKNSVEVVDKLKLILGPKGFKDIQATYLQKIMFPANSGEFIPSRFASELDKYQPETLRKVLGNTEAKTLEDLAKLSRITKGAEKIAANPSGTAQAVVGAKSLVTPFAALGAGVASGHPIAGAITSVVSILGPLGAAKLYLNPTVNRMMINGIKLPATSTKASNLATMIIQQANDSKNNDADLQLQEVPLQ